MNEIETILTKLLRCDRSSLYLDKNRLPLGVREYHRLEEILRKRVSGAPLQYLVGDTEFVGLKLCVKPGVLIPRPETEILVEEALKIISQYRSGSCHILDIGTGSGNIAIALAKFSNPSRITAVDVSPASLKVAKSNARRHHVGKKITFIPSDVFSCFKEKSELFDFIISNPPYIPRRQYKNLPLDVRCEPRLALLAKRNGLDFYSRIEEGARIYLKRGGFIFLEMGDGQGAAIKNIFSDSKVWADVKLIKDYNDIDRVAIIRKT